jgi:alkylation response protein AidB-like acyl-CoA dehydrogenase
MEWIFSSVESAQADITKGVDRWIDMLVKEGGDRETLERMRDSGRLYLDASPMYGGPGFSKSQFAEISSQRRGPLADWATSFYAAHSLHGVLDEKVDRPKKPLPAPSRFAQFLRETLSDEEEFSDYVWHDWLMLTHE